VSAHSGALAAADGAWEALAGAYGLHRVRDLAELADTLELFASGRRAAPGQGIATVHDSGLERAHAADLAAEVGVPFAALARRTQTRLAAVLDPGLDPANPLDVWGTGRDTEPLFTECLSALAADPGVAAVALAVDLVPEFDGDESYPRAVLAAAARPGAPRSERRALARPARLGRRRAVRPAQRLRHPGGAGPRRSVPGRRPGRRGGDRLPGRDQDRGAGHRAQVRRRRGAARPGRPGRGRRRLRRPGRPP